MFCTQDDSNSFTLTLLIDDLSPQPEEPGHKEDIFTQPSKTKVVRPTEGHSPVDWRVSRLDSPLKEETQLYIENGSEIESEDGTQKLTVPDFGHSGPGVYDYKTMDDDIIFKVDVKGDLKLVYIHTATLTVPVIRLKTRSN